MNAIDRLLRHLRLPLVAAILLSGVVVLVMVESPAPALAYDDYLDIDCEDDPVEEGNTFRLYIVSPEPYLYAKETMKVFWYTIPISAGESDYTPLDHVGQASNGYQTNNSKMGRTFYTTEDVYSEHTETFRVRANNASSSGSGAGACTIEVTDNDGPGAAMTWIESVPSRQNAESSEDSPDGRYHTGEVIRIKQEFTEIVVAQGGEISIGLRIGTSEDYVSRTAKYVTGGGTDTVTFEYVVSAGDYDPDGIEIPDSDYGGPGSFLTLLYNRGVNDHYLGAVGGAGHGVDGGPYAMEVSVSSTPADGEIYRLGEEIEIVALFDRAVQVNGTSAVGVEIGAGEHALVDANYRSGSETKILRFAYQVEADDIDPDGISLGRGSVDDNGGILGIGAFGAVIGNSDSRAMHPFYEGLEDQPGHMADGRPYITGVSLTSTPSNGIAYQYRDRIDVALTFDQTVSVGGLPYITVWIGEGENGKRELAKYTSGSLTNTLTFNYNVIKDDVDNDGISVPERLAFLGSGEVRVPDGGRLVNDFIPGLDDQAGHQIDGRLPYVVSSAFTSTPAQGQVYRRGEAIEVSLTFDQDVDVLGTPTIRLELGNRENRRDATYTSGAGTRTLIFAYHVQPADRDDDGVALMEMESDGIDGPYRVYQAGTENEVKGTIPGIDGHSDHRVAGRPYVTDATITSTPARKGIYRAGETIEVSLSFDQAVAVAGNASIRISLGDGERNAGYLSGSGTGVVAFGYAVQADDRDDDGISLPERDSDAFSGDGTISAAGTDVEAVEAFPGFDSQAGHAVAGQVHITAVSVSSDPGEDGTYEHGDTIELLVRFDDNVTVTGTPQLTLDFDGEAKTADFEAARATGENGGESGTTGGVLVFTYTAQEDDEDSDGIIIGKNPLDLNGGAIQDPSGNEPDLDHAEVFAEGHMVGAIPPVLSSARTSEDGTEVIVTLSENVHVQPEIRTLSAFAGVDVGIFIQTLLDVFVDDHRPYITSVEVAGPEILLTMDSPIAQGQLVEVAYDNLFADDVSGLLIDGAGNALAPFSSQTVINNSTFPDNPDAVWPLVSSHSLTLQEGDSNTYTMRLGSQPKEDVTVSLSITPEGHLAADPQQLVFTPTNWDTVQTITLTAGWDSDELNAWQEIVHSSDDQDFVSGHLKVLVEDLGVSTQ